MLRLYTQRQMDREIERRMMEREREQWLYDRLDRIEKRLYELEDKVNGRTPVNTCECNTCEPYPCREG